MVSCVVGQSYTHLLQEGQTAIDIHGLLLCHTCRLGEEERGREGGSEGGSDGGSDGVSECVTERVRELARE